MNYCFFFFIGTVHCCSACFNVAYSIAGPEPFRRSEAKGEFGKGCLQEVRYLPAG